MNEELRNYLKLEVTVAAAFNFFINGMIGALIHHKADRVAVDPLSIAIDLTLTCLFIFTLTALFGKASIRRTQTAGILKPGSKPVQVLNRLFQRPLLFGVLLGCATAAISFALIAPVLVLFEIKTISFGLYIAVKVVLCSLLGGGVTLTELYAGMHGIE